MSEMFTLFLYKTKTEGKHPFLCVHVDLPDNKYGAKDFLFFAFTLLWFCEAHCWKLQCFQKPPFLCVHIDQIRFRKPPFLWLSTFDSVFNNLRFVAFLCRLV